MTIIKYYYSNFSVGNTLKNGGKFLLGKNQQKSFLCVCLVFGGYCSQNHHLAFSFFLKKLNFFHKFPLFCPYSLAVWMMILAAIILLFFSCFWWIAKKKFLVFCTKICHIFDVDKLFEFGFLQITKNIKIISNKNIQTCIKEI